MSRIIEYECDENGYPVREYDISELKQITESSNVKADADPNKLHYDSLKNMAFSIDETEASIILEILVCRYPNIAFDALKTRMNKLQTSVDNMIKIVAEEFK